MVVRKGLLEAGMAGLLIAGLACAPGARAAGHTMFSEDTRTMNALAQKTLAMSASRNYLYRAGVNGADVHLTSVWLDDLATSHMAMLANPDELAGLLLAE